MIPSVAIKLKNKMTKKSVSKVTVSWVKTGIKPARKMCISDILQTVVSVQHEDYRLLVYDAM